jgi:predicted dehydrogenase
MKQKLCIVGSGWRGQFILKVARLLEDRFDVGGIVTRDAQKAQMLRDRYSVAVYSDYLDMVRTEKPDFVCVAASTKACPKIAAELCKTGMPVLMETAYLENLTQMLEFYDAVGKTPFAFMEQYHLQPMQQARLAIAQSGLIGGVFEAQISLAQCYHGISVMR